MFEESFDQAWKERFGEQPDVAFEGLAKFLTHRSVRTFEPKEIEPVLVRSLIGAAISASTSSNLQLWSVVTVQDPDRRARISELCANQSQVQAAPLFLAFCADHARLKRAAQAVGEEAAGLDYAEFFIMAVIDAALAAERLVCAAESMGLGVCYIGALRNDPQGVADFLNFPDGVFGVFGLCVGWPATDCKAEIKPRLRPEAVWHQETYQPENDSENIQEFNQRMQEFYVTQQMKGDVNWSMRSGRRVDGSERSLTGRGALKDWLVSRGFNRR